MRQWCLILGERLMWQGFLILCERLIWIMISNCLCAFDGSNKVYILFLFFYLLIRISLFTNLYRNVTLIFDLCGDTYRVGYF